MAGKCMKERKLSQRRLAMYERYVDKLRTEDFEKLNKFCKMHLSFLLDMDSERFEDLFGESQMERDETKNKSAIRFKRKKSGSSNSTASRIESSFVYDRLFVRHEIELAIGKLISFLQSPSNLCQEGLFRKSGNISRQKELKDRLLRMEVVNFSECMYTAHDCSSVLKSLIGDLDEPLLLERLFHAQLYTSDVKSAEKRVKVTNLLLHMLPLEYYRITKSLIMLLHSVSMQAEQNKMTPDNLGAVFAPHLLCPKKLTSAEIQSYAVPMQECISFIIENGAELFKAPELLALDSINYMKKSSISVTSSEDSIISIDSTDSVGKSSHKRRGSTTLAGDDEEAIETVLTFAERRNLDQTQQDTEVELAKLYAHVHSMPDSAKKRKLMKQFSEANGYQQQVEEKNASKRIEVKRKHSRSRSFGQSIRRRFSKRGKQKSMNVSVDQAENMDQSAVITKCNKLSTTLPAVHSYQDPEATLTIPTLCGSPYPLRRNRSSSHNHQPTEDKDDDPDCENGVPPYRPTPAIRKVLLPTQLNSTPTNTTTMRKTKPHHQMVFYQRLSDKEYPPTPPGPKRALPLTVMDESFRC